MKKIVAILISASVLIMSSCKDSGEKVTLKPNFKAGESYQLDFNMNMDQSVMGMKNNIVMGMGYKSDIKEASAQGFMMDMSFTNIKMNMKTAAFNMEYDSEKASASADSSDMGAMVRKMMGSIFGGMIGKKMSVNMNADGTVKEVKGFKEMMQAMVDSVAQSVPGESATIKESMSGAMSEDQIKNMVEQGFGFYPKKPVGVGDSWDMTITTVQNKVPVKTTATYKVTEINKKDNEIVLDVNGKLATSGPQELETGGMKMKMDMNGTMTGKITVDLATGFVKQGKINQDIKAKMDMMGQSMPLDMTNVITMSGKKL